jgi:raffinose/stachyose/melibiose transport system permease protein
MTFPDDPPARGRDRRARPSRGRGAGGISLWLILPALSLYVVLVIVPTLAGLPLSLTNWNGISHVRLNGLNNFIRVWRSPVFQAAMEHTGFILVAFLILANTVGLGLAVLLHSRPRGYRIYQTLVFLPVVISLVATGFVWTLMLDPTIGLVTPLLHAIGLASLSPLWLASPRLALLSVTIVAWWQWGGIPIVVYGAGLKGIPADVLEAAAIDGASAWQRFRRIVLPLLRPATAVTTILNFVTASQVFGVVYVLEGLQGAPGGATDVFGTLIYRTAFGGSSLTTISNLGYAETNAVVVMIILAVALGLIQWYFRRRTVSD